MVKAVMAGPGASKSNFASSAKAFLSSDQDTVTETQIAVTANRLNQPRWWKQFVGQHVTEEIAVGIKALVESDDYQPSVGSPDPAKIKALAKKLKSLINIKGRDASALSLLVADRNDNGYSSEPGEAHFHLGRLSEDLGEDLALAENLCEAVVRATDPRVVSNTYRFLVEQALGLLAGVEVVAVLADRFYEVTGAANGH